jgi:hypothetical protein
MKTTLVCFLLAVLPSGAAWAQSTKPSSPPAPARIAAYQLTPEQAERLTVARQNILAEEKRLNRAFHVFLLGCKAAARENHWPPVQCDFNDLSVKPASQPTQ